MGVVGDDAHFLAGGCEDPRQDGHRNEVVPADDQRYRPGGHYLPDLLGQPRHELFGGLLADGGVTGVHRGEVLADHDAPLWHQAVRVIEREELRRLADRVGCLERTGAGVDVVTRRGSRPLRVKGSGVTDDEPLERDAIDDRIGAGDVVGRGAGKLGEGRDAGFQERFRPPFDPGRELLGPLVRPGEYLRDVLHRCWTPLWYRVSSGLLFRRVEPVCGCGRDRRRPGVPPGKVTGTKTRDGGHGHWSTIAMTSISTMSPS